MGAQGRSTLHKRGGGVAGQPRKCKVGWKALPHLCQWTCWSVSRNSPCTCKIRRRSASEVSTKVMGSSRGITIFAVWRRVQYWYWQNKKSLSSRRSTGSVLCPSSSFQYSTGNLEGGRGGKSRFQYFYWKNNGRTGFPVPLLEKLKILNLYCILRFSKPDTR